MRHVWQEIYTHIIPVDGFDFGLKAIILISTFRSMAMSNIFTGHLAGLIFVNYRHENRFFQMRKTALHMKPEAPNK